MNTRSRIAGFAVLKVLGYLFGFLVVAVAAVAVIVMIRSNAKLKQTYTVTVQPVNVLTDALTIAQGQHLAQTRGCTECHGADFGGKTVFDNGAMGRTDAPNLTRGEGGVPADFRDEDFVRAIRHGVARSGRGLFLMPSADYSNFTDSDMGALIAYIKSVPAVNKPRGPIALGPVARALLAFGKIKLAADEIDHAQAKPALVTPAVSVEFGRYVSAACTGCHGGNFSGGKIAIGPPDWPPAANLTPHPDSSFAKWSQDQFIQTLRTAKRPDGRELNPAMPRAFGQLNDTEMKALWAFLKTLPAAPTGVH